MKTTHIRFQILTSLLILFLSASFLACTGNRGKIKILANSINSAVPMNIGDGFSLMHADVVGEDELVLSFQMHGVPHGELSEGERKFQEVRILDNLNNNPSMAQLKELKAIITYKIEDENAQKIGSFTFPYEKYTNFNADDYQLTDAELETMVQQMNKPLPSQVDEYTKLLEIKYLTPRTLQYSLELSDEITSRPKSDLNMLKEAIASSLRAAPQLHFFRIQKCNFCNIYSSKDKAELFRVEVSYEDYKQK